MSEDDPYWQFKKERELSNPDLDIKWNNFHEHTTEPGHFGFTPDITDKNTGKRYTDHVDPE
jgi:hypothetical protein